MTYDVTLIPGDGIGPEITAQTIKVLEATGLRFNWDEELAGVAAVEATGTPLPDATVESIRKNAIALKGPLTTPVGTGFRSVNVGLRKEFELFANVRPARTIIPGGRFENVDIVLVRENLEGLYIGVEHFVQIGDDPRAVGESMAIVTRAGCDRIVRYAFEYALKHGRRKVTIVHKANILKMVSGLFLEVGRGVAAEYLDRAGGRRQHADGQVQQCRLPGTVGADQPDDPPCGDVQRAVRQRPVAPVALAQPLGAYDGGHATSSRAAVRNVVMNRASMLSSSSPARRALSSQRRKSWRSGPCAASVASASVRVTNVPIPGRAATSPSCSSSR